MFVIHVGRRVVGCVCVALVMTSVSACQPSEPQTISFWNGNKTEARQKYEREVLQATLEASAEEHGSWRLVEDQTDYPKAADEAAVFRQKRQDVFVTVAGNTKLAGEDKIVIPTPLMNGLLGYRLLIIRAEDREKFEQIGSADQLKQLRLGIPETWADAALFRHNGYTVVERGGFDDLFKRLLADEFDYVAFGANEIAGVFSDRAQPEGALIIDQSLLIYYPFPLVYYVKPSKPALAERLRDGLEEIQDSGKLQAIFERYYGDIAEQWSLGERKLLTLENPVLPKSLGSTGPELLNP